MRNIWEAAEHGTASADAHIKVQRPEAVAVPLLLYVQIERDGLQFSANE
jgi:hypothetical protein